MSVDRTLLEIDGLSKEFPTDDSFLSGVLGTRGYLKAVQDVSLSIDKGETLALVGESGSGKSTLANLVTGLHEPTAGDVRFEGESLETATSRTQDTLADIGMVFQNPKGSLDPRVTVRKAIKEPMHAAGWSRERREERVDELMDIVDLQSNFGSRYPNELSGGQAQRVAIARAVALDPKLLVLDEPVSALDVSVQAKILNLLMKLQDELDLTYLFIAHDLNVVEHIADRVAVMYLGKIMEVAPTEQLFENPSHPYTESLLSAIPEITPGGQNDRIVLQEDPPSPVNPPSGCVFHTRCPAAEERCTREVPDGHEVDDGESRCHFAEEVYASE
ncbi:ABC transporter ATP-binding protein [Halomicrococcus sp. SG-WS-1]|uniref:ABC transporter ATP-binding protein n=1 Tax=Halomicrococcus sp. SG-WS-1 TaxID=3439057 RepID=UPI003F79F04F